MIYKSAIHQDLNTNSFTVFVILFSISLSVVSVRVLDKAAAGKIDNIQVLFFLVLSLVAVLPYILQVTNIISILKTFQQLYADSEMVIWEGAKMPLFRWLSVIFPLVLFISLLVALLVFFVRPWTFEVQKKLEIQFQSKQQWFNASTGVFHNFADNTGTLYVEQDIARNGNLKNLFLFKKKPPSLLEKDGFDIIISQNGKTSGLQNSSVVFLNGVYVEILKNPEKLTTLEFSSLDVSSINPYQEVQKEYSSMFTKELLQLNTPPAQSELFWRASMVMITITMALFSLALSYSEPRKRNSLSIITIIAIALIYFNSINILMTAISREKISPYLAFVILHSAYFLLGGLLVYLRTIRFRLSEYLFNFKFKFTE